MTTEKTASSKTKAKPRRSTQKYIRNLRNVLIRVRFGEKGRLVELKPRGQRGDLCPLKKDEIHDDIYLRNVDVLFELITEAQAKAVILKQTTNQQARHPAMNTLRNEHGQEYEGEVVMEKSFEDQGVTVARLKDGNVIVDKRVGIERVSAPGSIDNPIPEAKPGEDPYEVADRVARDKKLEGPKAGLGGMTVREN